MAILFLSSNEGMLLRTVHALGVDWRFSFFELYASSKLISRLRIYF